MDAIRTSLATTAVTKERERGKGADTDWGIGTTAAKAHKQKTSFQVERPLDIKNMHMSKTIWRPTMPTYACESVSESVPVCVSVLCPVQ